jgi:hypothetical protein
MKQNIDNESKRINSANSSALKKRWQTIWALFFTIGLLVGFGFIGLATVADMEGASFWGDFQDALDYNRDFSAQAELVNLRCPILLSPEEDGTITVSLRNNPQNQKDILVKAVVSDGDFQNYRVVNGSLPIAATKTQHYSWQVNQQDVILGNFILTRVFLMNADHQTPIPARTTSCGVFVLDFLGLSGTSMVALIVSTSFIFLTIGSLLLSRGDSRLKKAKPRIDNGLYILAGIILFGIVAALLGWWIISGLTLLLTILLGSILLTTILMLKK